MRFLWIQARFTLIVFAAAHIAAAIDGTGVAKPPLHESSPTMQWIRPVRESTQSIGSSHAPCTSHVTRDGYTSIQVNVDAYGCNISGDAANEPSIAIDPTDPKKIVIGWRQFDSVLSDFRQAGWAYSHDAGHTWVFQGSLTPGVFGSDPVLNAGPSGEIFYLSISEEEMRLFRSLDGGMSWLPRTKVADGFWDKPWMAFDRTHGMGRGNIYITVASDLIRSVDDARSFQFTSWPPLLVQTTTHVDHSGVLYSYSPPVAWSVTAQDSSNEAHIDGIGSESTCGATSTVGNPNPGGLNGQCWIDSVQDSGHDGWLFVVCPGCNFGRSRNAGVTFDPSVRVNDDPVGNGAWHWFTMLSVAPNGRIDLAWNDTRNYSDDPDAKLSELYYSYSMNYGDTWSPNAPVSPVFNTYLGWPQQNKIGDYDQMLSDNLGVNVAYAATFNGEQDIYFLRIGPWDCNGNQIDDVQDIASETSLDCNGNGVPDECEYRADFDGDGLTTYNDFATFLYDMRGPDPILPPPTCAKLSDIDHDGDVDLKDFYGLQQVFVTP
ncbi:MAG: EF-hand domain-containing protein [Planctomycetes bacterium]|nr:EF-hand domain-containing protein [Planctomycetota bacterium]MBI3833251.1 EF-hand domain-containing protein [Planctomycetota bacterium]